MKRQMNRVSFKAFDLGLISNYRTELMGVSCIAILLCHAPGNGVLLPGFLSGILLRGGVGVDVFLFLSGVGMYYSLEKIGALDAGSNTLLEWYKRRYLRILIPYMIIILPIYFIICCIRGYSFEDYCLFVTTVGFWFNHKGVWFIALLIPLYLISPILYSVRKRVHGVRSFVLWGLLISFCIIISQVDFVMSSSLFHNIQFCLSRVPCFLLGMYTAPFIKKHWVLQYPLIYCIIFILLSFILKHYFPNISIGLFWIFPIAFFFCLLFECRQKQINGTAQWFGKISLESYLFNVTLPLLIMPRNGKHWIVFHTAIDYGNYLPYALVILIGTILSLFVHKLVIRMRVNS